MKTLISKGELQRRTFKKNLFTKHTEITSDEECFLVSIITLNEWLHEQATDKAWQSIDGRTFTDISSITSNAEKLRQSEFTHAQEFVKIEHPNNIIIGIDAEQINNKALDTAVDMLADAGPLLPGRIYNFGKIHKINTADIHIHSI